MGIFRRFFDTNHDGKYDRKDSALFHELMEKWDAEDVAPKDDIDDYAYQGDYGAATIGDEYKQQNQPVKTLNDIDLNSITARDFEYLCQALVEKMGFNAKTTKTTGDGGIDIIAYNYQPLLSGKYIIQCKRYAGSVSEPIIRDLYGVVMSERANKGIVITTGRFTGPAINFAEGKPIELIDGTRLRDLLETYLPEYVVSTGLIGDCMLSFSRSDLLVKEDPIYLPLIRQELFNDILPRYSKDTTDIANIGHLISLFQSYVYDDNLWELDDLPDYYVYSNKRDAVKKIVNASHGLDGNNILCVEYWAIAAQSYFLLGEWDKAIYFYEKILHLPGVIDPTDDSSCYDGTFEFAPKIVHNICIIMLCRGDRAGASNYRKKYEYLFEREYKSVLRIIQKNPDLKKNIENDWAILSDTEHNLRFYFELKLDWGYSVDGMSMLYALYSDRVDKNEIYTIDLDRVSTIRINDNGSISVMEPNGGEGANCVFEISL